MARENTVYLYGRLIADPKNRMDKENKTDAISVDTKYDQVKSMMVNWIKNDIAVYLQNISAAISENNTEKANNALQDKDRVYDDFSLITQNIVALGSSISGADLTDIKSWTPEDYVDQEINGK